MAPSSGHLLVPEAVKVFKYALSKATTLLRSKFPSTTGKYILQPIRIPIQQQPTHPLAYLRQLRSRTSPRFYSTVKSAKSAGRPLRAALPSSATARAIHGKGFTPFASPLRPSFNGTVGRSTLGGARNFTSGPTCHAQALNNVSAAVRAFWLEGGRARYDGCSPTTGEKRFKRVSPAQDKGLRIMRHAIDTRNAKGSSLRFRIAPTVTALSSVGFENQTLGEEGVLDTLAGDFARSVQDLAAILADLKKVRDAYGDLPVTWEEGFVAVRFAGLDKGAVESLADEVGVRRGVVCEDEAWREEDGDRDVRMALLFPFAPSKAHSVLEEDGMGGREMEGVEEMFYTSPLKGERTQVAEAFAHMSSPGLSTRSLTSADGFVELETREENPWAEDSESGFDSPDGKTETESQGQIRSPSWGTDRSRVEGYDSGVDGYQGLESIYRFLAECDGARR
ncbi:hypothetical protein MMC30_000967 [Trapelia coarctata]|nr:hypothetical protein [Trapelia coarctata]